MQKYSKQASSTIHTYPMILTCKDWMCQNLRLWGKLKFDQFECIFHFCLIYWTLWNLRNFLHWVKRPSGQVGVIRHSYYYSLAVISSKFTSTSQAWAIWTQACFRINPYTKTPNLNNLGFSMSPTQNLWCPVFIGISLVGTKKDNYEFYFVHTC